LRVCRDAVGHVEHKDGDELIKWHAQLNPGEGEDDQREQQAAQRQPPPEARDGRAARSEQCDADCDRDQQQEPEYGWVDEGEVQEWVLLVLWNVQIVDNRNKFF